MRLLLMTTLALAVGGWNSDANAQSWRPPADSQRCPSRWGPTDERGMANHLKPATVLRAAQLVRTGEVIELGQVLSAAMPISATRQFELHTKRTVMAPGANRRGSNEELVTAEIGQVGTQFDGFAHQTIGDTMYNCVKVDDVATRTGFTKLGVEKVGAIVTRGVLLDLAALKKVDVLPASYEVTVGDLEAALKLQQLTIHEGDAVLIHTGWGRLWEKDNTRYSTNNPGLGVAGAEWIARWQPVLLGSDTSTPDVTPNPDKELSAPLHQIMLVVNGIHILENVKLDELAAKRAYEFLFVIEPLKIKGGTGSTVAPIAIR